MASTSLAQPSFRQPGRLSFWILVFLAALILHVGLVIALYHAETGAQTRYRGGGLFEEGGRTTAARLPVLVSLGQVGADPGSDDVAEPLPPEVVDEVDSVQPVPEDVAALAEPEATLPEPVLDAREAERTEESLDNLPNEAALVAAPPRPVRKPTPPVRRPELSLPEERLSAVGPRTQPQPAAVTQTPPVAAGASQPPTVQQQALLQSGPPSRLGTAGGGQEGEVPRLNYKERVLGWLKMHGRYPPQAARFAQDGTVVVEFKIDRSGRILFYRIVESSGYFLLDQAVRRMMDASSPVPPMPANVPGDELHFRVPVTFDEEAPV